MKLLLLILILSIFAFVHGFLNANSTLEVQDAVIESSGRAASKHIDPKLVVYVQTFTTPTKERLSLLPLLHYETKVTHIILASMHLHEEPGQIRLNDDPLDSSVWDTIWKEVNILQKNGIKVMALLGGAAGGTYKRLNGTDEEFYAYYNPLRDLIRRYHLDGLDIDVEEDVNISVPYRLMTALRRDFGSDFIITMAPLASALSDPLGQNLSGFSYFDLDAYATVPGSDEKLISWFNGMFYGGFARGPPFFQSVVENGWDPSRVVMGVLDCSEDGQPNGFVHIETLQKTIRDLREMYPGFGGVAGWEYHDAGMSDWDFYEPWLWVKKVGQALFEALPGKDVLEEL
ncbi:glycoside hydrolase superfamily [Halenospora varia]|nr:glycoside hydrolase superfamily [Halenospora varia]